MTWRKPRILKSKIPRGQRILSPNIQTPPKGYAVHIANLPTHDSYTHSLYRQLEDLVPERRGAIFALDPVNNQFTLRSLYGIDAQNWRMPAEIDQVLVKIKPGTLVGDMYWSGAALEDLNRLEAVKAYSGKLGKQKTTDAKEALAESVRRYRESLVPYTGPDCTPYGMPELLIPGGE